MTVLSRAQLVLTQDFRGKFAEKSNGGLKTDEIADLQRQLRALPGFAEVELQPEGRWSVLASVPARNQRERDKLKALLDDEVSGWRVHEKSLYGSPTTF